MNQAMTFRDPVWAGGPPCLDERAVLATMHGKERTIAPILARFLGLRVEVAWTGSLLKAARGKIAAAFDRVTAACIGWVLDNPAMSDWLNGALRCALREDPVALANDFEILRHLIVPRTSILAREAVGVRGPS